MPGSGAFVVEIGPVDTPTRSSIVPLPPPGNSGVVDFEPVFLSVAANFASGPGTGRTINVEFLRVPGPNNSTTVNLPAGGGRENVGGALTPADRAALISTSGIALSAGQQITALVEYTTP